MSPDEPSLPNCASYLTSQIKSENITNIKIAIRSRGKDILNQYDENGETAFHTAIKKGDSEMIFLLIDSGADINLPTFEEGHTPLMLLAEQTKSDTRISPVIRALLLRGVNINATNGLGQTALEIAVRNNSFDLANRLLNAEADPNIEIKDENGDTVTIGDMLSQKIGLPI